MLRRANPWRMVWGGLLTILMTNASWAGAFCTTPTALAPRQWSLLSPALAGQVPTSMLVMGSYVRLPLRGLPRRPAPSANHAAREFANDLPNAGTADQGITTGRPLVARHQDKRTQRPQPVQTVSSRDATLQPRIQLPIIGAVAREGYRYALPPVALTQHAHKDIVPASANPLANWDPFWQRELPTNPSNNHSLAANPRGAALSTWRPGPHTHGQVTRESLAVSPIWRTAAPWIERFLAGCARLSVSSKLTDKPEWKLAANILPTAPAAATEHHFPLDVAALLQRGEHALEAGEAFLASAAQLTMHGYASASQFDLASILPARPTAQPAASPLGAILDLPTLAAVSDRILLMPSAAQGFSTAASELVLGACRQARLPAASAALPSPAEPQR